MLILYKYVQRGLQPNKERKVQNDNITQFMAQKIARMHFQFDNIKRYACIENQ